MKILISQQIEKVSHIYQMAICPNQMVALAAYNGLYFIKIEHDRIVKLPISIFEGYFCNKVLCFDSKLMITIWGDQNFHVIDL
jgi:hypothetical protein